VLLHSACLSTPYGGLLLSAPADTGKTTTVLKILQSESFGFLSDDMTLLSPDGKAYCFPKPPTISYHTLLSIGHDIGELFDIPFLILRSRIHSKRGRQFMRMLGRLGFSMLSLNTLGQILIPPPKPSILSFIDSHRLRRNCRVDNLFFIDKGNFQFKEVLFDDALNMLKKNSDDAFDFPPYNQIVDSFVIDNLNFQELLEKERYLLSKSLEGISCYYLRSSDYSWNKYIENSLESVDPRLFDDGTWPTQQLVN
jgi:hypothetical protein